MKNCFASHAHLFSKEEMADLLSAVKAHTDAGMASDVAGAKAVEAALTEARADLKEVVDEIQKGRLDTRALDQAKSEAAERLEMAYGLIRRAMADTAPLEAPTAPAAPAAPANARRKGSEFLQQIKKAGGIDPKEAADLMGDSAMMLNRRLPGVSRKGGMSGDALLEWLIDNGYLLRHDAEDADANQPGDAIELAYGLVRRALADEEVVPVRDEHQALARRLEEDRNRQEEQWIEREAQSAVDEVGPDWSTMTDEEKDAELDRIFAKAVRADATGAGEGARAGETNPQPEVPAETARPSLELTAPTEAEVKAKEQQAATGKAEEKAAALRDRNEAILTPPAGTAPPASAAEQRGPTQQSGLFGAVSAARTEKNAKGETTQKSEPKHEGRLTDVGENLWANRRNFTRGAIEWDTVKDLNDALKVKEVVKAKVWPKPDYEKLVADGMQPFFARMLKQVYDGIAAAPDGKSDADLERYIDVVARVREAVFEWAKDNNANREFADAALGRARQDMQRGPIALTSMLDGTGPGKTMLEAMLKRLWPEEMQKPSYGRFRRDTEAWRDIRALGGNRPLKALQFTSDDVKGALEDISKGWPTPQEAWQRQGYSVAPSSQAVVNEGARYARDGGARTILWNVSTASGWGGQTIGESYENKADAEAAKAALKPFMLLDKRGRLVSQHDTEDQAKEAARELTKREAKGGEIRGMNISQAERRGEARREEGENVTPERLMQEFGFRGVNFGREGWINQAERQAYLNHAFDGLLDLAEILDVPPKALSLNGMLGIAFGAQGRGGHAAAHFVPGHNEINLTKTMGAGTLAHEWGHALDHYFATQGGLAKNAEPYMSAHATLGETRAKVDERGRKIGTESRFGEVRDEIVTAFKAVVDTMLKRPMTEAEVAAQSDMAKNRALKSLESWLQHFRKDIERTKTSDKALKLFDEAAERLRKGDMGEGFVKVRGQSLSPVVGAIKLIVRDHTKSSSVDIASNYNGLESNASSVEYQLAKKEATKEHVPQMTPTAYAGESNAKDQGKGGKPYWRTPWEMFARAFETYVASKLAEGGQENTFLSDAAIRAEQKDREGKGYAMPYPRGEDRERINAAVEKLVGAIETKETDQGVAMFSRAEPALGPFGESIRRQIEPVLQKWANAPEVHVIASMAEAPQAMRTMDTAMRSSGATGIPEAFIYGKAVYLVADGLAPGRIFPALFHESLGHFGLRGTFGERLNPILDRVAFDFRDRVAAKAREYGLDVSDLGDRRMAAEEVLAELAQNRPQLGIVRRLVAAIRQFLRDIGIDLKLTDEDVIANFIAPARAFVERGRAKTAGVESPAFSRAAAIPAWVQAQPAQTREALRKAGIWHQPPTLKDRVAEWSRDWQQRVRQGLVDQFDPIKNYDYKAYMHARMTKGADAALEGVLMNGTIYLDQDGAVDVKYEKGGFLGILSKLNNEHDRFFAWVIGNRAERLMAEGREHNFTAEDISRLKALNQGQMKGGQSRTATYEIALNGLNRYNRSLLDMAEKAGLIDPESRSVWEKDFYIPFYRLMEEERVKGPVRSKGLVRQYAFKTLKGGAQAIGDPLENVLRNWAHLIDASLKNQAAKESVLAAANVGAAVEAPEAEAREMAKSVGKKDAVVHFLDQGVPRHFVIDDPFLLDAIQSIGFSGFQGAGMKIMGKVKRWLTFGVTVSPTFRIRNIIRDSLTMIGTNPASYNVLDNIVTGWKMTKEGDPLYASLIAGGGVMRYGTALEGDRAEHVKRMIEAGIKDDSVLDTPEKVKEMLTQAWDWWMHVGDRSENVNRAALYHTLRNQGKSHLEASYAARDTMDFSMQGTWAAIRFLAQTVPFFNARLQGLYKLGRGAQEDPQRFAYVVGGAALASIALLLAYKDDDDWKQREDFDRETFWFFKIGDKAFRIPKPFEIGAIGTLAERAVEAMITDELTGKQFAERMGSILSQQLSMNPIPQLIKPMIEAWANKDFFTDRAIETSSMEKLSRAERIAPGTSATAQLAGKAGLISPVQIDHLVNGYFGWLGTHVVATADLALRPAMGLKGKPSARIDEVLVAGDFVKDLPAYQSKYVTHLYDQAKRVQESLADYHHALQLGDREKAAAIYTNEAENIRLARLYTASEAQLSKVNSQIRIVQQSPEDSDTKRLKLDRLYAMRNSIAKFTDEKAKALRQ